MNFASNIPTSSRAEIANLFARAFIRLAVRNSAIPDVNVTFRDARKSQNSVDEIAQHEQLCVHADGGAKG